MAKKTTIEIIRNREINDMLEAIDERQDIGGNVAKAYALIGAVTLLTGFANPILSTVIAGKVTIEGAKLTYILDKLSDLEDILLGYQYNILRGVAESVTMTVVSDYWDIPGIKGWVPVKVTGQLNNH